jgi:site-specific DNA-methyltransferase (adenine-specific)
MPRKAVGNTFLKKTKIPTFFGEPSTKGNLCNLDPTLFTERKPQPFYRHPNGTLWIGDSLQWLQTFQPESADLIFADPPYNIGKAEWDQFVSLEEYVDWSIRWIELAARVLKKN